MHIFMCKYLERKKELYNIKQMSNCNNSQIKSQNMKYFQ